MLQSGGDMSNDEHLAEKLTSLLHAAVRAHQSNADTSDAASFKRLAGLCHLLKTSTHQQRRVTC